MLANQDINEGSPFCRYGDYVKYLRSLNRPKELNISWRKEADAALNGQASLELQEVASLEDRRKFGAFFTGSYLAAELMEGCKTLNKDSFIYDPTCGAGDLLIAAAKKLPLGKTINDTLLTWGKLLAGTDLHKEFINCARLRLILLARHRHNSKQKLRHSPSIFFPHIHCGDGLKEKLYYEKASHILLNPPYGLSQLPTDCSWAKGKMTYSALFTSVALEKAKGEAELFAILPEVLRSGSFSKQWQNYLSTLSEIMLVKHYGIFDSSADIDVFLLHAKRSNSANKKNSCWPTLSIKASSKIISDYFRVKVGTVVPHRDKEIGELSPFVHPRILPAWEEVSNASEQRQTNGYLFKPPFVAIRRTSRAEQSHRAVATIVKGRIPVAVENHLIVCSPKDSKLSSCRKLLKQLKNANTDEFLNKFIRCRHLTVSSIKEIPLELDQ